MLIPAVVAVAFAVARRYLHFPRLHFTKNEEADLSHLQWPVAATIVGVGIVFGLLTYEALRWTNAMWGEHDGHSRFLILPTRAIWAIPAILGSICLSWEITHRLWGMFGQRVRALQYKRWSSSKAGFDTTRALQLMGIGLVLPTAIAVALALPIHASFRSDQISIGHYGAIRSNRYLYSDITRITVTESLRLRNGSLQHRPAITLDFANGDRWSSADNRDPDKAVDQTLLNFLQEKTGLQVYYLDAFPFGSA
jgi:hypothetical protein